MGLGSALEKMTDYVTGSKDPQLLTAVMEVQRELIAIQEENRALRQKVIDLENIDIISSELIYRGNCYYRNYDGPFCTKCFDDEGKLIRMSVKGWYLTIEAKCPKCNNEVLTDIIKVRDSETPSDALVRYKKELKNKERTSK